MTTDDICPLCGELKQPVLACPTLHVDPNLSPTDKELAALLSELGTLRFYTRRSVFDELEREAALWAALKRVAPSLLLAADQEDGSAGKGGPGERR